MGKRDFQKEHTTDILDNMVIARLEKGGETFEVLVDPDVVDEIRGDPDASVSDHIAIDKVFRDVKKGERASVEKMMEVFGTEDPLEISGTIIRKGEIQVTTEQRRAMIEEKRRAIVSHIARNAVNPQTGTPHPPQRIENAMSEAGVHIDPFRSADDQLKNALDAIRPIIPISIEKVKIAVKLSAADCPRCYGDMKTFGEIIEEEWQKDGSWIGIVEMPAGLQTDFIERLSQRTHGNLEAKILKKE
ncbi:MAG: ribosome assembly factor SBDS [Thermoplasmata archaeon]